MMCCWLHGQLGFRVRKFERLGDHMAGRAPTFPKNNKAAAIPREEQIRQLADESLPLEERVRQRAHEIYLQNGGQDGSDLEDWLQAEAEILAAQGKA